MSVPSNSAAYRAAVALCVCLVMISCGCANRIYRVTDLPEELTAPATEDIQSANLSRLATYSVSSELIERGDVLDVTLVTNYGDLSTTTTPVRVGQDDYGDVPLVGRVQLAGLELEGAEQAITSAAILGEIFRNPHITVTMNRRRVNKITVIGSVNEPGVYELSRGGSSLLAALVAAGGLSEEASPDVEIRRPVRKKGRPDLFPEEKPRVADAGPDAELVSYAEPAEEQPRTIKVNLVSATVEGKGSHYLDDGDVVVVGRRNPKRIQVIGLVNKPNQYDLPVNEDLYLLDALALAGGRTSQLADNVLVIRRSPGQSDPVRIRVSISEAKSNGKSNLRLAAGDVVSIEETPITFVLDALGRFVRVGLSSSLPLF